MPCGTSLFLGGKRPRNRAGLGRDHPSTRYRLGPFSGCRAWAPHHHHTHTGLSTAFCTTPHPAAHPRQCKADERVEDKERTAHPSRLCSLAAHGAVSRNGGTE